jgi:hypothetical protein
MHPAVTMPPGLKTVAPRQQTFGLLPPPLLIVRGAPIPTLERLAGCANNRVAVAVLGA